MITTSASQNVLGAPILIALSSLITQPNTYCRSKNSYEANMLTDLMGDETIVAYNMAIEKMVQAGAIPFTWEGVGA